MRPLTRPFAAAAASLLLITSCGSDGGGSASSASTASDTRTPVVVDTDLALDDILALLYVASNPDVHLLAVTVSGTGEVLCPVGADNARRLLAAVGVTDVPVACGQSQPLSGDHVFPLSWRTLASRAYDLELPEVAAPSDGADAVTLLTDTIGGSGRKVTLLTLGPLTNVAQALKATPSLTGHLAGIVMMGGAVTVDGNVTPEGSTTLLPSEWNFYIDPQADTIVFASGAPLTLVALDATNHVPVTQDITYLLNGNQGTTAITLAGAALDNYVPAYLWDPLAAIAAAAPAQVPTHEATIAIRTDGDEAGRTVADPAGAAVNVADPPPDPGAVIEHWVRILAHLGPDDPLGEPKKPPLVGYVNFGFDGTACTAMAPAELPVGTVLVTVEAADTDYAGIVAHLTEGSTYEEAAAYATAHPGEAAPMVDAYWIVVFRDPQEGFLLSPAPVELQPGTYALICGVPDGTYFPAASFTVIG